LTGTTLSDTTVGLYMLGEQVNVGNTSITTPATYSRFTTSPSVPSWLSGPNTPPSGSCTVGSLYSCTKQSSCAAPSGGYAVLYACLTTGWTVVK
jgi:hypothetical protein